MTGNATIGVTTWTGADGEAMSIAYVLVDRETFDKIALPQTVHEKCLSKSIFEGSAWVVFQHWPEANSAIGEAVEAEPVEAAGRGEAMPPIANPGPAAEEGGQDARATRRPRSAGILPALVEGAAR